MFITPQRSCDFCLNALSALLLLCSFFTFSPKAAAEDEFLFILKGRGNVFWKTIRDGIEESAKTHNIRAVILHTDDDQTPEAQLNMCITSLARRPKFIVMGAATKNVGLECYKKAVSQGVLAADIDGNVTIADAKAAGVPLAFSVGSDNELIGKAAAEYIVTTSSKKDPAILVIKGLPGSIVSEKRARGFIETIKSSLPEAQIVGSPSADWDRLKAMNTALDFMQREAKLDYIFSASDVMTMGVVEAVRVAAKKDTVQVISVDGIADARKAITEGRMQANVAQLPYLMGKRAVELVLAAAAGKVNGHSEYTPTPVLTKKVLEMNEDPLLAYLR